ncbi:MAG TPA: hypothetical protein ENK55_00105 [Actinobacteria bacterium]|nr:hypothetical protein [Actinomycetota bacterium]
MTDRRLDGLVAGVVALLMVATAVVAGYVLVASGVLADPGAAGRPARPAVEAPVEAATDGVRINGLLQLSQPRDPFRPLITPDSPAGGIPPVGGGAGDGSFTPGTSITLIDVRDVGGTLRATIVVNGVSYDVGEGETFAGSYKVVELTEDSAVIMYGDTVFELEVGQQILK